MNHRGRPRLRGWLDFGPVPYKAEKIIREARKCLTFCCLRANLRAAMPTVYDALAAIEQQLRHDCTRVRQIRKEMEQLAPSYNRFLDLRAELENKHKRIQRAMAVFGPKALVEAMKADKSDVIGETVEVFPSARELRDELVLWAAIERYLAGVDEAKVEDIQAFLLAVEIPNVSRQAIESAVKTHPKVFRIVRKGRARYIALRENPP